jgi:hypothetical protein
MPVKIRKNKKGGGYSVRTPHGVKAKNTTLENAKSQERLLNAIEHNPDFKPRHKKMAKALMG